MADSEPTDSRKDAGMETDDELDITDLRHHVERNPRGGWRSATSALGTRMGRRLALALVAVLLFVAVLNTLLAGRDPLANLIPPVNLRTPPTPVSTATETPRTVPTPAAPLVAPTALPGAGGVPALAAAPAQCGGQPPTLTPGLTPPIRASAAIGGAPVWVGGFDGPYATLRLGPAASLNAYGWSAPYTLYGWPAPISLLVQPGFHSPVTLSGRNPRDGHPLWFGFIEAGAWGPPSRILPGAYTVDPAQPFVPAGGFSSTGVFWYGYVFLPGAGCYELGAQWPGGSWQVTVSAGK